MTKIYLGVSNEILGVCDVGNDEVVKEGEVLTEEYTCNSILIKVMQLTGVTDPTAINMSLCKYENGEVLLIGE